jgi:uncharacterized protein
MPEAPEPFREAPAGATRLVDDAASPSDQTYCMFMHLSILAWFILPVLAVVIPLVMWLVRRDDSRFIDDHGRETVNFHISFLLYSAILVMLFWLPCIAIPGLLVLAVLVVIASVLASVAASRGEFYRYPMCIRIIR